MSSPSRYYLLYKEKIVHDIILSRRFLEHSCINKVGLLGNRFTMEEIFYKSLLTQKYGLDVIIPNTEVRGIVHRAIFNELVVGEIRQNAKERYLDIIQQLVDGDDRAVSEKISLKNRHL